MFISKISSASQSFNGLFETKDRIKKSVGNNYYNRCVYNVYNIKYHPFPYETQEEIQNTIDKNKFGYTFSLMEVDHGHVVGDYYFLNNIQLGDVIDLNTIPKEKISTYTVTPKGIEDKNYIYSTYQNYSYAPIDYMEFSGKKVDYYMNKINNL